MQALSLSQARPAAAFTAARTQPRSGRRVQRCMAMADEENKGLDFTSNKRAALGFTESDSAGQTNIFAVEPKTYVAGSTSDKTSSGAQSTLIIGGIAAVVAAAAVGAGLLANSSNVTDLGALAPVEGVKSLSAYSELFSAELGRSAAPALSE